MRTFCCFLLLIILPVLSADAQDPLDAKTGVLWGIGMGISQNTYPVQFTGTTKKKVDDSAMVFGPLLSLGFNVNIKHLILGLRAEGMSSDNFGTGSKEDSKITNKLDGKVVVGSALAHLGWAFVYQFNDPVGYPLTLLGEFFIEGGLSKGSRNFSKNYSFSDGSTNETYDEKLEEDFEGRILSVGFNFATPTGAFFELKFSQVAATSNVQTFTGSQSIGGVVTSLDKEVSDNDLSILNSVLVIVGKQY